MKHYFRKRIFGEQYFDEFLSHLNALYDLVKPIAPLQEKYDNSQLVFDESIDSKKRVRPALELYSNILTALKFAGIWNVRKNVGFNRKTKGEFSVRGI